jgi:hypothetical protein
VEAVTSQMSTRASEVKEWEALSASSFRRAAIRWLPCSGAKFHFARFWVSLHAPASNECCWTLDQPASLSRPKATAKHSLNAAVFVSRLERFEVIPHMEMACGYSRAPRSLLQQDVAQRARESDLTR